MPSYIKDLISHDELWLLIRADKFWNSFVKEEISSCLPLGFCMVSGDTVDNDFSAANKV